MKLPIRIIPLLLFILFAGIGDVIAGAGHDHGVPEPEAAAPGASLISASGSGVAFDAVLKYEPFFVDDEVSLTLYLVSSETNRAVEGATVSASLSDGDQSKTINFEPIENGIGGSYSATVVPTSGEAASWLFDIFAGEDYDLISVDGFKPSTLEAHDELEHEHEHDDSEAPPQLAVLISIGSLLLIAAFVAGRLSAGKQVST